jgi:hypothetical protein
VGRVISGGAFTNPKQHPGLSTLGPCNHSTYTDNRYNILRIGALWCSPITIAPSRHQNHANKQETYVPRLPRLADSSPLRKVRLPPVASMLVRSSSLSRSLPSNFSCRDYPSEITRR